jgi:uncharacterized protein YndB with AHSA1/START domain
MVTEKTKLDLALDYARRGWRVFPCHYPIITADGARCSCSNPSCENKGKHPATKNGLKDATTDVEQIARWWTTNPNWNIAIATGAESNLVVVDVDNHGTDGTLTWKDLEKKHGEVITLIARTGGEGLHYLFTHPGIQVKNRTAVLSGIDVRGDGGYIVAPGSIHASGREYGWLNDIAPQPMPMWMLDWLLGDVDPSNDSDDGSVIENIATNTLKAANLTRYVLKAVEGEIARVANAV